MSATLLDLTERLVPISDFSHGKTGKIFNDVAENNNEYIVMKNNQPTAVLLSVEEYRNIQKKVAKLEELLEQQGISVEELEEISESNGASIPHRCPDKY